MNRLLLRALGNTGINVSPLGIGTVKFGRNEQVKYPCNFKIPDDQAAANLLSIAKEAGINLVDTAPAYGNSEERLGKLITGQRKDWIICTKTGEEFINGKSHFDFSVKHTVDSINRSLKRLNTDYLDIVLIHSDGNDLAILEQHDVLQTLSHLKQKGIIRAIGMSTKTIVGGIKAAELSDIVMVTYNLMEKTEKPVIDFSQKMNKGILIKKALASGHVCNKNNNIDLVRSSMNFALSHKGVSSIIIGTINPQHLLHNINCATSFNNHP